MGLLAIQWNAVLSSARIINAFCIGCLALLFVCGLWIYPASTAKQKHNVKKRISNTNNVLLRTANRNKRSFKEDSVNAILFYYTI